MKTKKQLSWAIIILVVIVFASCNKKPKDQYFSSYFPLAVGNTWIYTESYFYPDTAQTPNNVRQINVEIEKDTIIDGNQLAYIVRESSGSYINRYLWYEADNELRERYLNSRFYYVLYNLEMEKGSKWVFIPNATNQEYNTRKVIDSYENFQFLNNNTLAYKLQNGNPYLNLPGEYGEITDEIFAPGIGLIEGQYKINYYGPSRRHKVLTDYYTN